MCMMFFSGYFAGLVLAILQALFLCYLFAGSTFLVYIIMLRVFILAFLVFPTLLNYLFKSQRLGITLREDFMLWALELKPVTIGALLQDFYLFFVLNPAVV